MKFLTASYSDIGGRSCNEDTVRLARHERGGLCVVVADGLGGHGGGDVASQTAASVICSSWNGSTTPQALIGPIQKAHGEICAMQTRQVQMRSTVVALVLDEMGAAHAHAGDSRLYHFVDGRLVYQTVDHSASQLAVLMEEITVDQIRFHEDRNRILRCLGQQDMIQPTALDCPMDPGAHAFLLCTDGFWEYVLEPEMEQDLQAAADPQDWIDRMRARLKQRIPADNDNNTAAAVWTRV